jgi:Polyketide cyclase / dehydrase and lipid transport
MPIDVTTAIEILRPRPEVAGFAMDPTNATGWNENIKTVSIESPGPLVVGSKMAFQATFLGRSLAYTYEVKELEAGRRLVMRTSDGPFPMETTYQFEDADYGGTKMILRNRGEPAGFSRLVAPFIVPAMRRTNHADLKRLKAVIEGLGIQPRT